MAVGDALSSLARSPSSAAVLHGWMDGPPAPADSSALDGLLSAPPSSAFRATNYHTFGSDSVASAHCGDTPKMRGAPRHIPFTGAITKAASRFIAPSAVSPVRRGHLSLRLSFERVPFSHLLPEYHQRTTKLTFNGACHVLPDPPTALIHMNG